MKDCQYATTSGLSCPSTYIPFFSFSYDHPSLSSQWSAVLIKMDSFVMPFYAKIPCILGLATMSMISLAFKKPPFTFFVICVLISSTMSLLLRFVPHFQLNWWRERSLHLKKPIAHSWTHCAWFGPHPCVFVTTSDALHQVYFRFLSVYSGSKNCPNVWPFWKDWPAINKIK